MQKRGGKMKTVLSLLISVILVAILTFNSFAEKNNVSWYCVRKKDNTQPTLSKELAFSEKYDVFWCDKKHQDFNDKDSKETVKNG